MSAMPRWRWSALLGASLLLALPPSVSAADLSLLSDFGQADIAISPLGSYTGAGNVAGIYQKGDANTASIDQAGIGNHAEVWQFGNDNVATLTQAGNGNQMAIQQPGVDAVVNSSQNGYGNQLVLQQQANSQFISTQTGNLNQMVVDLPAGMALRVDQVGNGLSFSFHPN